MFQINAICGICEQILNLPAPALTFWPSVLKCSTMLMIKLLTKNVEGREGTAWANLGIDLGVLEHKLHQAHRNAVQAELNAAGLQEVGHPLLLCILRSAGDRCPDGQVQAQRELSTLLDISPAAVATSLKSLEKKGYIHREPEPGDAGATG